MTSGYTVFTTYILVPESISLGYGYSPAVHCNYINKLVLDVTDISIQEVAINFTNVDDFKFLNSDISNNIGYTANKIYAIIQVVDNSTFTTLDSVKPIASDWKIFDLTPQIITHSSGNTLTAIELTSQIFKIPLNSYNAYPTYYLHNYINYPSNQPSADEELCFGDEIYFFGNVSSDIKATAYTTDISIFLDFNEFNSSTNNTWGEDKIAITEIGIYDSNKNLVAIGKLNNPLEKDSTIARTIVFDIDF